jgi:hypothetical protein
MRREQTWHQSSDRQTYVCCGVISCCGAIKVGRPPKAAAVVRALSSTGIAEQTVEQLMERTQKAIQQYFDWLQNTMAAIPWGYTNLK